jgi:hypothetical protein
LIANEYSVDGHGKVNVLEIIEDFEGMDGAAFWQDFYSVSTSMISAAA